MKIIENCLVCGSADLRAHYVGHTYRNSTDGKMWPVIKCADCGHAMMSPQPSWEELQGYYNADYDPYTKGHGAENEDDAGVVSAAIKVGEFRHIQIPKGKSVLDLGCGAGYFLRICKQLGAKTFGIEPSIHGYQESRSQGLEVFNGTLEQFHDSCKQKPTFDLITSNHVIEHVPDPVRTLSLLKEFLAPGGMIWISVPNADGYFSEKLEGHWHSADLPYHIQQFCAKSMSVAGRNAGLRTDRQYTYTQSSGAAASIRHVLRKTFLVPQKLTERIPYIEGKLGPKLAAKHDREGRGEALITEFRV